MKRRSIVIGAIIFIAILIGLVYFATTCGNIDLRNMFFGAVGSLIASVFFLIIPEFVLKNNDIPEIKKNIEEIKWETTLTLSAANLGVKDVKSIKREETNNNNVWIELLHNSKSQLYIITRTANTWFDDQFKKEFMDCIIRLANSGGKVKIVILSPDNIRGISISNENLYKEKIENSIKELKNIVKSPTLKKHSIGNIELRLNSTVSFPYSYIRNDTDTLVSPYLYTEEWRSQYITVFDNKKM